MSMQKSCNRSCLDDDLSNYNLGANKYFSDSLVRLHQSTPIYQCLQNVQVHPIADHPLNPIGQPPLLHPYRFCNRICEYVKNGSKRRITKIKPIIYRFPAETLTIKSWTLTDKAVRRKQLVQVVQLQREIPSIELCTLSSFYSATFFSQSTTSVGQFRCQKSDQSF